MIAGMRAGWLTMALVLATYMLLMLKRENRELRRSMFTIPALAVIVLAVSYFASPLFQERLDVTRAFTSGSEKSIDASSMERVPIFTTALTMYREHPVNGVGVRAFPQAYMIYAEPGDMHIRNPGGNQVPHMPITSSWRSCPIQGLSGYSACWPPSGFFGCISGAHSGRTPGRLSICTCCSAYPVSLQLTFCDLWHLHLIADLVSCWIVERFFTAWPLGFR